MVRFECEVTSCCNEICSVASFSKSLCCENVKLCGNVATATIHVVWFQDSVWYPWWRGDHLSLQPARTADCQVSWSHAHLSRLPIYCGLYCMAQRGDKLFWNVCFWSLWANFWSMWCDSSTLSIWDLSWVTCGVKIWCIADSTNYSLFFYIPRIRRIGGCYGFMSKPPATRRPQPAMVLTR